MPERKNEAGKVPANPELKLTLTERFGQVISVYLLMMVRLRFLPKGFKQGFQAVNFLGSLNQWFQPPPPIFA
jgi:hypothetical protein